MPIKCKFSPAKEEITGTAINSLMKSLIASSIYVFMVIDNY